MVKRRAICHACNRPFDPSSPGATQTLGPTCAKLRTLQLSFADSLGTDSLGITHKPATLRAPKPSLPAALAELYREAKVAFDELFGEFCKNGTLLYDEKAMAFERMLTSGDFEVFGFDDPLLDWLEPEHLFELFVAKNESRIFLRRNLNGSVSLIYFDPQASISAQQHVQTIKRFHRSLHHHHARQDALQLSLF